MLPLLHFLFPTSVSPAQQMNRGVEYRISNPAPSASNDKAYGFRGQYLEVNSPIIVSQYSQVNWPNGVPKVPLPAEVVRAFDGKVMWVTGWEVDIRRDTPAGSESVPCYESYNHHYVSYLKGKGADLEVRPRATDGDPTYGAGHGGPQLLFPSNGQSAGLAPSSQAFSEHNGNEARQTYHSLANSYGVPIESPESFVFNPMQINTRNPDGSGRRCDASCPLPRSQNSWAGAKWSGLIECPCGSRMVKTFDHHLYSEPTACTYNSTVTDAAECFTAVGRELKQHVTRNGTVTDPTRPHGCLLDGGAALFNTAPPAEGALSCALSGGGSCICRSPTGWINGHRFAPHCMGEPKSELLKRHNPTCDLNLYDGGMACCGGFDPNSTKRFLLDAHQPIPPLVDQVYFKWRFYYIADEAHVLRATHHVEWQFGHIEYSVPKAMPGTPVDRAVHTLTTNFSTRDMLWAQCSGDASCTEWARNTVRPIEFVMLGFHCHSPSCLGGKLINADTGEVYCHVKPVAGRSAAPQDEESYLWLPPCQWGSKEEGLLPPPKIDINTNFSSIKWANNSVAHFGVMAIWQGRAAYAG